MRRFIRHLVGLFVVLLLIAAAIALSSVQLPATLKPDLPLGSQSNRPAAPTSAASGSEPRQPSPQALTPPPLPGGPAAAVQPSNAPPPGTADPILQQQIQDYLDSQPGTYGVAVEDLATGRVTLIDADRTFASASTYKLLVMYCVYQQLATGKLSLETPVTITDADAVEMEPDDGLYVGDTITVGAALRSMIEISSNAAAYALVRTVGGWGQVLSAAKDIGMERTARDEVNGFLTTPNDMLTFFLALAQRKLVSPEASDSMLVLLARQPNNDRIPAELPDGVLVAHKTGELPGVRNDVGIVFAPSGRYVICVFADGGEGSDVAITSAIAHVSRLVYDRYAQPPGGQGSTGEAAPR